MSDTGLPPLEDDGQDNDVTLSPLKPSTGEDEVQATMGWEDQYPEGSLTAVGDYIKVVKAKKKAEEDVANAFDIMETAFDDDGILKCPSPDGQWMVTIDKKTQVKAKVKQTKAGELTANQDQEGSE